MNYSILKLTGIFLITSFFLKPNVSHFVNRQLAIHNQIDTTNVKDWQNHQLSGINYLPSHATMVISPNAEIAKNFGKFKY